MSPGSVIIDLAAEAGGNCELTKAGETVVEGGVKVIGTIAIAFGTINIVGGFMVTDRMLGMFRRKPKPSEPASKAPGAGGSGEG